MLSKNLGNILTKRLRASSYKYHDQVWIYDLYEKCNNLMVEPGIF